MQLNDEMIKQAYSQGYKLGSDVFMGLSEAGMDKQASSMGVLKKLILPGAVLGGGLAGVNAYTNINERDDVAANVAEIKDEAATQRANLQNELTSLDAYAKEKIKSLVEKQRDLMMQLQSLPGKSQQELVDYAYAYNNPTTHVASNTLQGMLAGAAGLPFMTGGAMLAKRLAKFI